MRIAHPPFEYLATASVTSLESFELSRLNIVANLRKELRQVVDEWIEAEVQSRIARWILERRRLGASKQELQPAPLLLPDPAAAAKPAAPALPEKTPAGHRRAAGAASPPKKSPPCSARPSSTATPEPREQESPSHSGRLATAAAPAPSRAASASIPPAPGRQPAAISDAAAAASSLHSLERVARSAPRMPSYPSLQPGTMPAAPSGHQPGQLSLPGCAAAPKSLPVAARPAPQEIAPAPAKQKSRARVGSLRAPAQADDSEDRVLRERAAASESEAGEKPRAPFRPLPLYRKRVAAAS